LFTIGKKTPYSIAVFLTRVAGYYLLAETGTPIIELVDLEALARDRVYEFAFIAASLKLRGADAAPLRPIAIPLDAKR
jgi:kynurenine formamidase